jgi:glycosyltransferase involved in cell wall biosynthesis
VAGRTNGERIRVAFVDQSGDAAGGAEESLALLLRYLPSDIEPRVIVFSEGAFAQRLRSWNIDVARVDVASTVAGATRERAGYAAAWAAAPATSHLARLLRAGDFDVVHTNTVKAHFIGGAAAWLARIPSVVHFRDLLEGRARTFAQIAGRHWTTERIAITRAVSAWYGLDRTSVIDEPLELDRATRPRSRAEARARLGLPQEPPIVAIVGRINRWKGHDRFVRAAALVAAQTDAHFAIVGAPVFRDADFAVELHTLVAHLGLSDRVTFVPWTNDVDDVYAAIDVHCNCSTREPFGRTTVEAAVAGVPTVCFADGGAAEAIVDGETGVAVARGNVRKLADAIIRYVREDEHRRLDGARGRAYVARYDARRHAENVAAVIRRAARR